MPTIKKIKKELKLTIIDNIANVLKRLDNLLDDDQPTYNDFISFQSKHRRWKKSKNSRTVAEDDLNRQYNQLEQGLLGFIDLLEEKHLKPAFDLLEQTHENILLVAKTTDRLKRIQALLPEDYFPNQTPAGIQEKTATKGYDIILFDNTPHEDENSDDGLLKHYLEQNDAVVLYFGRFLPIINHYPEKVYATNSVFSIHARIKELTEYLKYKTAIEASREK